MTKVHIVFFLAALCSYVAIAQDNAVRFRKIAREQGLSQATVTTLYQDYKGFLWLGTFDGLNKYDGYTFKIYKYDRDMPGSLSANHISALYEDKHHRLWIGTVNGGLNRYDRDRDEFIVYQHDPADYESISSNCVTCILEDSRGQIWVGTMDGLNRFDRKRNAFTVFSHRSSDPHSIPNTNIYSLCDDRNGNLWIGTLWGLSRYNKVTGQFTNYYNNPGDPDSLMCNIIYCLLKDHAGVLWIGTQDGLSMYDEGKDTFTNYKHDQENKSSLSAFPIFSLYEDSSHVLWIGTWGGGVIRYENITGHITHFNKKDGLANEVIYSILQDESGCLWFSTNNGISRFNPQDGYFRNFDTSNGLSCNEFNFGAACKNINGEMFFGGINGLNVFHPKNLRDDLTPPFMAITDFRIFNPASNSYENRWIGDLAGKAGCVELSHQENIFSIEFSAIHYAAPEKNEYAYMLEGFDRDRIPFSPIRQGPKSWSCMTAHSM